MEILCRISLHVGFVSMYPELRGLQATAEHVMLTLVGRIHYQNILYLQRCILTIKATEMHYLSNKFEKLCISVAFIYNNISQCTVL